MYAFELHRPSSVSDAAALLARTGGRPLAGGQSLVGAMRLRLAQPGTLVDLSRIAELRGIKRSGQALVIGATTRHAEVASSDEVKRAIPALARLAEGIGDRQVRNMGTIGGSIANNDPAADWPAALLALGASVVTNRRELAAEQFFTGLYETALGADEIVAEVRFPIPQRAGYEKFRNPASRFALVGVFVAKQGDGSVRVAVTGAGSVVFRCKPIEDALAKQFAPDAAKAVTVSPGGLNRDLHASPEYRAHLIPVLAARAVAASG
jgi:carbon-monoxide dehydrogenase medium subunit